MTETAINKAVCKACGAEVREEALFCYHCGAAVTEEKTKVETNGSKTAENLPQKETDDDLLNRRSQADSLRYKQGVERTDYRVRRQRVYRRQPIEVIWEGREESSNSLFVTTAILLVLLSILLILIWTYIK